jgi:hypothetical protein
MCEATVKDDPRMQVVSFVAKIVVMAGRNDYLTVLWVTVGFSFRVSDSSTTAL